MVCFCQPDASGPFFVPVLLQCPYLPVPTSLNEFTSVNYFILDRFPPFLVGGLFRHHTRRHTHLPHHHRHHHHRYRRIHDLHPQSHAGGAGQVIVSVDDDDD
jgi:hypothetical protein